MNCWEEASIISVKIQEDVNQLEQLTETREKTLSRNKYKALHFNRKNNSLGGSILGSKLWKGGGCLDRSQVEPEQLHKLDSHVHVNGDPCWHFTDLMKIHAPICFQVSPPYLVSS